MDDKLLDDDEALDFALYEEMQKDEKDPPPKTRVFGVPILLFMAGTVIGAKIWL